MPTKKIALIIHAGAGSHPKNLEHAEKIQKKLGQLCKQGHRYLKNHSALNTVTEVIRWLEDWPETNAGTSSMLQAGWRRSLVCFLNGWPCRPVFGRC